MTGKSSIRRGLLGDRLHLVDESLDCMRSCDRLIADAVGDAPLRAFWVDVKCEYQAGLSGHDDSAAPACLIAQGEGPDIPVGPAPVIVGRDPWCDAWLDSIRVSRIHCCLTVNDGLVVVLDLGSSNGTRINGRRVELGRLGRGDELSVAHFRYRLDYGRARRSTRASFQDGLPDGDGPTGAPTMSLTSPRRK